MSEQAFRQSCSAFVPTPEELLVLAKYHAGVAWEEFVHAAAFDRPVSGFVAARRQRVAEIARLIGDEPVRRIVDPIESGDDMPMEEVCFEADGPEHSQDAGDPQLPT